MQNNAVICLIETVDRADGHAGRVRAMHAGNGDGSLSRFAVINGDHAAAINPPGNFMLILARRYTSVAFNTPLSITEKFHSSHNLFPLTLVQYDTVSLWFLASVSLSHSHRFARYWMTRQGHRGPHPAGTYRANPLLRDDLRNGRA